MDLVIRAQHCTVLTCESLLSDAAEAEAAEEMDNWNGRRSPPEDRGDLIINRMHRKIMFFIMKKKFWYNSIEIVDKHLRSLILYQMYRL